MKSITIHGLDDDLDSKIRGRARTEGLSLNKTLKMLVREALGVGNQDTDRRQHFQDLFGTWTESDLEEFNLAIIDLNQVDPDDWK